jgi:two-component system NtrC family response regulator
MRNVNLLVVEDDPLQRKLIKENLEEEGYTVFEAENKHGSLEIIAQEPIDVAIVDFQLNGETGLDVIQAILDRNPLVTPVMVTAFGNIENAVEAMRRGAYDYIVKPINYKNFLMVVERALERQKLGRWPVWSIRHHRVMQRYSFLGKLEQGRTLLPKPFTLPLEGKTELFCL